MVSSFELGVERVIESDGGDVSIAPRILLICWPLYGISAIMIILRLVAKLKIHLPFALEDLLITLAIIFGVGHVSCITWGITYGLGRHSYYLTEDQSDHALMAEFIGEPFAIISSTFGRISFAVYLLGLMGHSKKLRRFLYFLIIQNLFVNISTMILLFFICSKISYSWSRESHADHCWPADFQKGIGIFQGTSSSFTDLCLTILPIAVIMNLHLQLRHKIALSLLLGVSSFALVASVIRTCLTADESDDETYTTVNFIMWCAVENCTIIIASSIPFLRPLFRRAPRPYAEMKDGFGPRSPTTPPLTKIIYRSSSETITVDIEKTSKVEESLYNVPETSTEPR